MFSVRETPGRGLGAVLQAAGDRCGAIEASGLGWSVATERIAVDRGDELNSDWSLPRCEDIPGYYATVRPDTHGSVTATASSKATIRWSCLGAAVGLLARCSRRAACSRLAASSSRTRM
jgi:hypothetical protein